MLSPNAGRVVTYASLIRQAWRGRARVSADAKLVRAVVKRLRGKLGDDAGRPAYIQNERGVGYRMPRPDDSPVRSASGRSNSAGERPPRDSS